MHSTYFYFIVIQFWHNLIVFLMQFMLFNHFFCRKKEKLALFTTITEAMANPTIQIAPNFPYLLSFTIEVVLRLCDDPESDVRMVADECLNRLIRVLNLLFDVTN